MASRAQGRMGMVGQKCWRVWRMRVIGEVVGFGGSRMLRRPRRMKGIWRVSVGVMAV